MMAFENFKREVRLLSDDMINSEINDRKSLLLMWSRPHERLPMVDSASGKLGSRHPYRKIRKELAILYTIINERQLNIIHKKRSEMNRIKNAV